MNSCWHDAVLNMITQVKDMKSQPIQHCIKFAPRACPCQHPPHICIKAQKQSYHLSSASGYCCSDGYAGTADHWGAKDSAALFHEAAHSCHCRNNFPPAEWLSHLSRHSLFPSDYLSQVKKSKSSQSDTNYSLAKFSLCWLMGMPTGHEPLSVQLYLTIYSLLLAGLLHWNPYHTTKRSNISLGTKATKPSLRTKTGLWTCIAV